MVIKLKKGESVRDRLMAFLEKNRINSAFFYGIGGISGPTISFYDLKKKKYLKKKFPGHYEVLSLIGNAAHDEKGVVLHMHVSLGDKNFKVTGGHFFDATVAGTLELKITQTELLTRAYDKDTGLNLLQ